MEYLTKEYIYMANNNFSPNNQRPPRQRNNSRSNQSMNQSRNFNSSSNQNQAMPNRNRRYNNHQQNNYNHQANQGNQGYDTYYNQYPPQRNRNILLWVLGLVGISALAAGSYYVIKGKSEDLAQIVAVTPNYITTQQPYQSCHKVGTTHYVKNQKDGTKGAIIGGTTGAVAGGIIGNQIKHGGTGTVIGAIAGGTGGALVGREIERSNQPDYIEKHGSTRKCETLYRSTQSQSGYNVRYLYKDNVANIVVANQLAVGSKLPLAELTAMAMPTNNAPVSQ
jgi:uncharacterized protein YcfJ